MPSQRVPALSFLAQALKAKARGCASISCSHQRSTYKLVNTSRLIWPFAEGRMLGCAALLCNTRGDPTHEASTMLTEAHKVQWMGRAGWLGQLSGRLKLLR